MRADLRAARPDLAGVVFEVEPPAGATGANREQRVRRIAFYRANGAAPVDTRGAYHAPAFRGDGTVSFDLMVLPLVDAAPEIEGPRLRQCVAAMLRGSYGLGPEDPFIDNVIAQLP
jgi:hypothetical protein